MNSKALNSILRKNPVEIILLLMTVYFLRETYVAKWAKRFLNTFPGPTFLPRCLLILMIIFLAILIVESAYKVVIKKEESNEESPVSFKELRFALMYVVSAYILLELMCRIIIIIPVFVFLGLWMYYLGYKNCVKNIILSLAGGMGVYILTRAMGVMFIK